MDKILINEYGSNLEPRIPDASASTSSFIELEAETGLTTRVSGSNLEGLMIEQHLCPECLFNFASSEEARAALNHSIALEFIPSQSAEAFHLIDISFRCAA